MGHGSPELEKPLADYLNLRPGLVRRRQHTALRKALAIVLEAWGGDLESFIKHARENNGNGLHKYIQHLVNRLTEEGAKPKTILFYLFLVKKFLEFHDVECEKAFRKVAKPKKTSVRQDIIPDGATLQRMLYATKSERLRMLIQLLAQTGLRIGEALQLRRRNIDLEGGWIHVPGHITKTGRPRSVPIIGELREALRLYVTKNNIQHDDLLFPSHADPSTPWKIRHVYDDWRALLRRIGRDTRDDVGYQIHPHCLRKFFKTRLEMGGVNRLLIMLWMGHDAGVQSVYFLPSPQEIKAEVEKAEKALTIFGEAKRVDDEKISELEAELAAVKTILRSVLAELEASHNARAAAERPSASRRPHT